MFLPWKSCRILFSNLDLKVKVRMFLESLVPHELCQVIWNHVTICWGEHWFKFCFSPSPYCLDMVCCHPSVRIDKVILVVGNIMLETLSSNTIVSTPHIAPNFCSQPDPLYHERHQSSRILTWKWQQKTFLACRIITSKNPLLRYYFPSVVFFSRK